MESVTITDGLATNNGNTDNTGSLAANIVQYFLNFLSSENNTSNLATSIVQGYFGKKMSGGPRNFFVAKPPVVIKNFTGGQAVSNWLPEYQAFFCSDNLLQ